jgi:predicted CXXCH cytochrome family protein
MQNFINGCCKLACLVACFILAASSSLAQVANAGYLQPGACDGCHQEIADGYSRTAMARTFGMIRSASDFPELKSGSFFHSASEESFTVYSQNEKPYLRRQQLGFDGSVTNTLSTPIDYWFGSGNHARSYISRTRSEKLVELPITWYRENKGYWAMSPGYDRPDHAGFSRSITYRCMFCHNAYPEIEAESLEGGTRFPRKLPEGIDCQRCHGPGQDHVSAVRQGLSPETVRRAIVNPARLAPVRRMEVCMQCHLETTSLRLPANALRYGREVFSFRPGEPLEDYLLHFDRAPGSGLQDRFEVDSSAYRLRMSECYASSGGALVCTTCHNPHEPSNTPAALQRYVEACQGCHRARVRKLVAEGRHPGSRNCVSCHMPKRRPDDAIHVAITDHYIQKSPEPFSGPLVEHHDGNTPAFRGEVVRYYPPVGSQTVDDEALYLAVAQVKHDANLELGLLQLQSAIARQAPSRYEFYFELAEAYRRLGQLDKAVVTYEQACSRAPQEWLSFYRLGTAYSSLGRLSEAASTLQKARTLAPKETAVLEAIADLLSLQGRLREAVATLQTGLDMEPESATLHSNLGARMLMLGDKAGAEKAWREAVRLRPEAASMRLNLANLLSSGGSFPEAEYHFRAALRSDPSFADAHLSYGIALETQLDWKRARDQYETALRLNPNYFEAHLRLGQILCARNEAELAAPHLRKAAESPDARVRAAANQCLRIPSRN